MLKRIAILASGGGSNALKLFQYLEGHAQLSIEAVVSNKKDAGVLDHARAYGVETLVVNRSNFYESELVLDFLEERGIDFIVLAGFLWLIPSYLLKAFFNRIVNLHPSLLPAYGGMGMYGRHVHEAVIRAGERESGITVHVVNERYDEGQILLQARCTVFSGDTPETLAARVQQLEHTFFPVVVEYWASTWSQQDHQSNK
jgi:phosphoribosylglycinamide formyltransferase-1